MINMIYSISYKENIVGDGDTNDLVFNIKEDLQFFKEITLGSTIIMGRNTFLSLPTGGLPKRKHVIVTSRIKTDIEARQILGNKYIDNLTFIEIDQIEEYLNQENLKNNISIIGGAMLYSKFIEDKKLLSFIDNVYATEVERVPNIVNPIRLEAHNFLEENFISEILREGSGKDRLNNNKIVKFKVIKYFEA